MAQNSDQKPLIRTVFFGPRQRPITKENHTPYSALALGDSDLLGFYEVLVQFVESSIEAPRDLVPAVMCIIRLLNYA